MLVLGIIRGNPEGPLSTGNLVTGATNAGLILTHSKKEHTRRLDTLTLSVRYNLFASLRAWLNIIMRQTPLNMYYPVIISLR